MRKYDKQKTESEKLRTEYSLNLSRCKNCGKEFEYDKKDYKFCSRSCSATFNNSQRGNYRTEESKQNQSRITKVRIYTEITPQENVLCDYGCNQVANFITSNGKNCCSRSSSSCKEVRRKNSIGTKINRNSKPRTGNLNGNTFNIEGYEKARETRRKNLKIIEEQIMLKPFEEWRDDLQRKQVFEEQEGKCLHCQISEWNEKKIVLELDHIDGNNKNCKRGNLRFLCPNCHSQTETFRGRNTVRKRVSDEDLLNAYLETSSKYKALEKCKMATKGANYERINKLVENLAP